MFFRGMFLRIRPCSSVVERFLGKEEAIGSIPIMGFKYKGPVHDQADAPFRLDDLACQASETFFWLN